MTSSAASSLLLPHEQVLERGTFGVEPLLLRQRAGHGRRSRSRSRASSWCLRVGEVLEREVVGARDLVAVLLRRGDAGGLVEIRATGSSARSSTRRDPRRAACTWSVSTATCNFVDGDDLLVVGDRPHGFEVLLLRGGRLLDQARRCASRSPRSAAGGRTPRWERAGCGPPAPPRPPEPSESRPARRRRPGRAPGRRPRRAPGGGETEPEGDGRGANESSGSPQGLPREPPDHGPASPESR